MRDFKDFEKIIPKVFRFHIQIFVQRYKINYELRIKNYEMRA
jgi:hypothetical protein